MSQEPESNQRHAETCYSLLKNYNPPLYQLSYPEMNCRSLPDSNRGCENQNLTY